MFDAKKILDQFIGGQQADAGGDATSRSPQLGGMAGGALAGGLAALLAGTKTGRKIGKTALTYGGTALVGGLAYKAWSNWRSGQAADKVTSDGPALQAPPADSAFLPAAGEEQSLNRSLIRAMIAAANADGRIDGEEQQRIFRTVNELGLSTDEKAFVMDELASPADVHAVASAATCQETAAELYLVSLLAIDDSGAAERDYLTRLAAGLQLEKGLVEHLHASAAQARVA